jgi:hypothetical protein
LLKNERYTVQQIRKIANHQHDNNIREWIHHQFNKKRIDDIISKKINRKQQYMFDYDIKKKIVQITYQIQDLMV